MEPKKTYLKLHLCIMHILLTLIHGRPRLRARDLARGRRHAAADGAEPDVWKQRVSRLPAACLAPRPPCRVGFRVASSQPQLGRRVPGSSAATLLFRFG